MSRRCGQRGSVERKGNKWHLRYWYDTADGRSHRSEPICSCVGKEKKTKSEAERIGAEWLAAQGINTEEHLQAAITPSVTFRQQSKVWLDGLQTRTRRPIPKTSVPSIQSALDCWLIPTLGDVALREVNNAALRQLVNRMTGNLAPKTINTYINIAKEVVESLLNENGEPVCIRKWNNDFIDVPIVNRREQRRPKLKKEQIRDIIASCETEWERMLYILCPATGMRIAEALAVDINEHINTECSVIQIRRQVKGNKLVHYLKTEAAHRDVDLAPCVSKLLRKYICERTGLLFPSKTGRTPMTYSNVRRRSLHPKLVALELYSPGAGMHCFRRFRNSVLKKNRCPDHLENYWLGHENRDIGHEYAEQLQEDVEWRQEIAAQVGIGFDIPEPTVVPNVPKKRSKKELAKAA